MEALKGRITSYWSRRVNKFLELRLKEFQGEKKHLWLDELTRLLPKSRSLKILDAGTGTGFLAFLLASLGHCVTAIDLTPAMISAARDIAAPLKLPVEFFVMDAEAPSFPVQSFDAIVSRNLTWTLPHLAETYRKWHSLLKPGGILINFDADYCREKEPVSLPANHAHAAVSQDLMVDYRDIRDRLRQTQHPRPEWDRGLLVDAGFQKIVVDTGLWKRVYRVMDEFYNPVPVFAISATA